MPALPEKCYDIQSVQKLNTIAIHEYNIVRCTLMHRVSKAIYKPIMQKFKIPTTIVVDYGEDISAHHQYCGDSSLTNYR